MTRVNAGRWAITLGAMFVLCGMLRAGQTGKGESTVENLQPVRSMLIIPELAILLVAGTAGGVLVGIRAMLSSKYRSAASRLQEQIYKVSERLAVIERRDITRRLSNQKHFLTQFKGESLVVYKALVTSVRELRARLHGLDRRINYSRHVLDSSGEFPSVRAYRKAIRLITGDRLSLQAVLFPGQLPSTLEDYPAAHAMVTEQLVGAVETNWNRLQEAISDCTTAAVSVNQAVEAVSQQHRLFCDEGFGPVYQQDLSELEQERTDFLAELAGDPISARKGAKELCEQAKSLKDELAERLNCKAELESAVRQEISELEERIAKVRSQQVVPAFPEQAVVAGSGDRADAAAAETFKLREPNVDIDLLVVRARDFAEEAIRMVLALPRTTGAGGEGRRRSVKIRPEADYLVRQRSARQAVAEAGNLIDRTLAAKTRIESEAKEAYRRLAELKKALDYALPVKQKLVEIGVEAAWQAEADLFRNADLLLTGAELELVKKDYFGQAYLAGLERIEALLPWISQTVAALQRTEGRLNQLKKCKRSACESVLSLREKERSLCDKQRKNEFTTARRTLELAASLSAKVEALERMVTVECQDWPKTDKEVQQCAEQLAEVEEQISQQQKDHEKAVDKLESLALVISEASQGTSYECTRRLARTRMKEASTRFAEIKQAMETAGGNWSGLQAEMEEVKKLAREASKVGTADKLAFDRASRLIEQALLKQKRLGKHASGGNISEKMRVANQALADAQSSFRERAWEEAERCANQADTSYRGALNARGY